MALRIAIVGATGLVGQELLRIIEQHGTAVDHLGLLASASSAGQLQRWLGREWKVEDLAAADFSQYHAALFCIGDELSAQYVPQALAAGCAVVDKSNAFRLDAGVPLVIAGVNDNHVTAESRLCANPNCSTIILQHVLAPLVRQFGAARVWAATYQSVSGAGTIGVEKLAQQVRAIHDPRDLVRRLERPRGDFAYSVVPAIGGFDAQGRCSEEAKLVEESRKVLDLPDLDVVAHAVRVPVMVGHSIAVTAEFEAPATQQQIVDLWNASPDVEFLRDELPVPTSAARTDKVEAGRLRQEGRPTRWSFFVSGDNLRIGAALNGWRILELMVKAGAVQAHANAVNH